VASDHALIIARMSFKLKATPKIKYNVNPTFDSSQLSTAAAGKLLVITLSNKFEAFPLDIDTDVSIESTWNTMKKVYNQTTAAMLGYAKRPNNQWL